MKLEMFLPVLNPPTTLKNLLVDLSLWWLTLRWKMKFGVSEGMVIASGPGGKEVFLLSPDEGAKPGQRVH